MIQQILAIWSLVPLPFQNPAWTSRSSWFTYCCSLAWRILSIPLLAWDECNCAVVSTFFGIAFFWDWNENWPFPVLWPLLSFPNLLAYWVQQEWTTCPLPVQVLSVLRFRGCSSLGWPVHRRLGTCHIARADACLTSLHFTSLPLAPTLSVQPGRDLVAEGTCYLVGCTPMPSYGTRAFGYLWGSVLALWVSLYWRKQILSGKLNNTMIGWGGKEKRGKEGGKKSQRMEESRHFVFWNFRGTFIPLFELWAPHFPFGLSSANYVAKPERAVRRHVEWGGLRHGTASSPQVGECGQLTWILVGMTFP